MCPTPRPKADGSSEHGGVTGNQDKGRKRKCWLMKKVDNCAKKKLEDLQAKITDLRIDGITLSQGLIIKFGVEFSYPLSCDITKCWNSATYTLKNHDTKIFYGEVKPRKQLGRGKRKKVEVEINIPVDDLRKKLGDIVESIVDDLLKCKLELDIFFRLPVIGTHKFSVDPFEGRPRTVSDVLEEYFMPNVPHELEIYAFARIALDLYEGNKVFYSDVDALLSKLMSKSQPHLYHSAYLGLQYLQGNLNASQLANAVRDTVSNWIGKTIGGVFRTKDGST